MGNAIKRFKQSLQNDKDFLKAAEKNDLDEIKRLLKIGVEPDVTKFEFFSWDWTAFHYAAFWNSFDVALYLINNYNISAESKDLWGWTPLHIAVMNGNIDMVKLFLECDLDINIKTRISYPKQKNTGKKTPREIAKRYRQWEILELFQKREKGIFHESVILK